MIAQKKSKEDKEKWERKNMDVKKSGREGTRLDSRKGGYQVMQQC